MMKLDPAKLFVCANPHASELHVTDEKDYCGCGETRYIINLQELLDRAGRLAKRFMVEDALAALQAPGHREDDLPPIAGEPETFMC